MIDKSKQFATVAHTSIHQQLKYTNESYINHPAAVAKLVARVTDDAEMIAAAWLHDTVEDTLTTLEEIEQEFGARIAQLISDLTNETRLQQKSKYSIDRHPRNQTEFC